MFNFLKRIAGKLKGEYFQNQLGFARLFFPFEYKEVEKFSGIAYAAIDLRAKAIARARFRIYRVIDSDEFIEIDFREKPYQFLQNLNPVITKYQLLYKTAALLDLTGNAYWYVVRNKLGEPAEVWVLDSELVRVVNRGISVTGYEYYVSSNTIKFDVDEIIHFYYPDPYSHFYGKGPLQAALISVEADMYMKQYWEAFFKNSANPRIVYESEPGTSIKDIEKLRSDLYALYTGSGVGKPFVLPPGIRVRPVSLNPVELDWLKSRQVTMEDIIVAFQTPKSKLGLESGVNKAIAEASDYTFKADVIEPILTLFDEILTKHLLHRYYKDETLIVKHDSVVPKDRELLLREYQLGVQYGWLTPNEIRKLEGWKPYNGGDIFYFPVNLAPIGQISEKEDVKIEVDDESRSVELREITWRDIEWRKLSAFAKRFENQIELKIRKGFRLIYKDIIEQLNEKISKFKRKQLEQVISIDVEKYVNMLLDLIDPAYRGMIEEIFKQKMKELGKSGKFDWGNAIVSDTLNLLNSHIKDIVETTIKQINEVIEKELEVFDGSEAALQKLIELINNYFNSSAFQRARTIAITSVTAAINASTLYALLEAEVKYKVWLSQRDDRVRETHRLLDGTKLSLEEDFKVMSRKGEVYLRFPGDPRAPAEEIVNCRCYIIGVD